MKAPVIEKVVDIDFIINGEDEKEAACITQTIQFTNVESEGSEYGRRKIQEEVTRYKKEEIQEDGSIVILKLPKTAKIN